MTLTGFSLYAKVPYKLGTLIIYIYNYTVMSKLTAADMMFSIGEELCLLVQGKKAVRCSDAELRNPLMLQISVYLSLEKGKKITIKDMISKG